MNFKVNETVQKLQGSYYTPKWIADFVARWIRAYHGNTVLEPSCGDGVFFQALADMTDYDLNILGFDTDKEAISQCKERHLSSLIHLDVKCENFLDWAIMNFKNEKPVLFDAVVGNPPFIRYQYLDKDVQKSAQELFTTMGQKFTKHTNAWLPFVLASVEFLKPGGHIGMVIPAEILHVLYAQGLREYLISSCRRILLVDPEDIQFMFGNIDYFLLMDALIETHQGRKWGEQFSTILLAHLGVLPAEHVSVVNRTFAENDVPIASNRW